MAIFTAGAILDSMMDWVYSQVVGLLSSFFTVMGGLGVELFELSWVQAVVLFFCRLGWALFGVSLVVCCFECGIEYTSGRGSVQQTALNCLKGFLAVSLFSAVPVRLYALSVSLQSTFLQGLTGYGSGLEGLGQQVMGDLQKVTSLSDALLANIRFGHALINSPLLLLFCVVLMAYAVITVFFSSLKRGGILLIQIAVGALYMFSVPRGYIDGFVQWVEQVIGLCLTAFLQAVLLAAGLLAFTSNALLGLGLMLSAMEVPRIAGAFGLDTSAKASLSSAVHTAQSAVSATRMIVQVVK